MAKTNKFQAILNILRGEKITMKTIFSADNKELVFPELAEDAPIEIGAKATFDGAPAEGEITSAEGVIYIFEMGVLMDIKETVEEEVTEDEMVEALAATLELSAELEERVNVIETEVTGLKKERDEFKDKLAKAEVIIAKLKGTSKTVETVAVDRNEKKEGVAELVANWKNNRFKKN